MRKFPDRSVSLQQHSVDVPARGRIVRRAQHAHVSVIMCPPPWTLRLSISAPPSSIELIGVVGGLWRHRAAGPPVRPPRPRRRRRQIEDVGRARPPLRAPSERAAKPGSIARSRPPSRGRGRAARTRERPRDGAGRGPAERGASNRAPEPAARPAPSRDPRPAGPGHPVSRATTRRREPAPRRRRSAPALAPGLARTRSGFDLAPGRGLRRAASEIDPAVLDEIEKVLLTADIGVRTSQKLLEEIRSSLSRKELEDPDAVWAFLRQRTTEMLSADAPPRGLRLGQTVRAADHRRQRQREDDHHRQAGGAAGRRRQEGAAGRRRHVPRRRGRAAGDLGQPHRRDPGARQGGRRSLFGDVRRRQARSDRRVRRRHRRHGGAPAHQDGSDGGAAEGSAGDREGGRRARRTRPGW